MELMGLVPLDTNGDLKEPKTVHNCEVLPEEDEINSLIKGNSLYARINRWLTRKRILSTEHHYAQTCLKSQTAIKYEISYHLQNFPYMVHPFSPFRNFWDMTMTVFTLGALLLTPYLNAFFSEDHMTSLPFIAIIEYVMLFDVILQFFTGRYDPCTKTVVLDPRIIFTKYIKGYFVIDLLSALPVELFDYLLRGREVHDSWYCSSLKLIKIFRMRNLFNYIHQFHKAYYISFRKIKITQLLLIVVISIHWAACLVYYVPMVVNMYDGIEQTRDSWIYSESMQKRDTRLRKYILCLNRATISLVSSAHYLQVKTAEDMFMNLCLAVFGKIGFIYLISQFHQIMTTIHSSYKERLRLLKQLQEYMQYKELPRVTQKRLLLYCNYWYKKNFNRDIRILAQVSAPLREELILHNYMILLETVELFKLLPRSAIVSLANFIKPEIYLASDTIVKSGTRGDSLFFIGSGTVAVYTSFGKEVCHLEDGAYFGEIALIIENELRIANVVAIETTEILLVPRESFQQVIAPYPNLLSRLQKVALERLEKTLLLDEIWRLEDLRPRYINISNIRECVIGIINEKPLRISVYNNDENPRSSYSINGSSMKSACV